ncbi:hypothetical protein Tco_0071539 [Tanacetum coccineum]
MAALQYKDDHNKIAYLGRERGCEDFTDILSYLDHSPLSCTIAAVRWSCTESLIRTQLPFDDANGIFDMPNSVSEGSANTFDTPMLAIAAAGDDAADEENAAAHEAAGSTAEAHPEPHSPPVSPVREPTPERQPETEWVVPIPPASPPTPPAQTFMFEEPLVFGPAPRPAGDVDPDVIESIIFGPQPRPHGYVDPDFVEPIIFGPQPRPDNYLEPEDLDNLLSMEDDTIMVGFHWKFHLFSPMDAHTSTDFAAGRAEDLDDVDLDGLSRMASAALGHDQPTVPSEDVEEREEEEVPLRRKRSAYRRARTEFSTPAFEQFQANLSAGGLPHTAVSESAGPSVAADKGKAPMPDLDIPAEFLAEDAQARKCFEEEQASERLVQQLQAADLAQEDLQIVSEQRAKELDELMMRMTETDWLNLMMQVGSNPALARELLGADVTEENFIEPHNGTITMTAVKAMTKQQLIEEYEYICRRLEKDRLLSAHSNPAASATPMAGSAASNPAGGTFDAPGIDSTIPTTAALDSAGS